MHAKPDLRVNLKWMIAGSGSVITDVTGQGRWLTQHLRPEAIAFLMALRELLLE